MATRQRITKRDFLAINRAIKEAKLLGGYSADAIAQEFRVSATTVRVIGRAGTWPKFEALKAERRRSRQENQGVHGVAVQQSLPHVEAPERRYEAIGITRHEYRNLMALEQRVEQLEQWRERQLEAEKTFIALHTAEEDRRRGLFRRKR